MSPRRRPAPRAAGRRAALAALAALGLAACWPLGGGVTTPSEPLPSGEGVPNALVVALGPQALAVGAARLNGRLEAYTPILLEGGVTVTVAGAEAIEAAWTGAELVPLAATLSSGPAGLGLALQWRLESATVSLTIGDAFACSVKVAIATGAVEGGLTLGHDKAGRVQARVLEGSSLSGEPSVEVDPGTCVDVVTTDVLDGAVAAVVDQLGRDVLDGLSAALSAEVPVVLGLSLAMGATLELGDDGIGSGAARLRVNAPEGAGVPLWTYSSGNLIVPFTVALETERHPCVPASELPALPALPKIPSLEEVTGGHLFVNAAVAKRAMASVWMTGAACGDHATRGLELPLDELAALWPALDGLGADALLQLRLWPRGAPAIDLEASEAGGVTMTVGSDLIEVELLAELDGARVRLATLGLDIAVTGSLDVDEAGGVWLVPTGVAVEASGASAAGLVDAPSPELAALLAAPLATALFANAPLWRLPSLPNEAGPVAVRLVEGYLGFGPAPGPAGP